MDRFEQLEQQWERSKRKQRIAYLVALPLLVLGAVGVIYYQPAGGTPASAPQAEAPKPQPKPAVAEVVKAPEHVAPKAEEAPAAVVEKPAADEPVHPTVAVAAKQPAPAPEAEPLPDVEPPLIRLDQSFETEIPARLAAMTPEEPVVETSEENDAQMVEITSEEIPPVEQEQQLLEGYIADPSYASSIRVARFYFGENRFDKAREWALKANELDKADDESWFLFASAALKLGETDQAKTALETYLQQRDSLRIRELYNTIR